MSQYGYIPSWADSPVLFRKRMEHYWLKVRAEAQRQRKARPRKIPLIGVPNAKA